MSKHKADAYLRLSYSAAPPHQTATAALTLRFGCERRLVTLRASARPHSGAQAVTPSARCRCGVGAHPRCSANGLAAGPALVGVSVLAAEQVRVDCQRAG